MNLLSPAQHPFPPYPKEYLHSCSITYVTMHPPLPHKHTLQVGWDWEGGSPCLPPSHKYQHPHSWRPCLVLKIQQGHQQQPVRTIGTSQMSTAEWTRTVGMPEIFEMPTNVLASAGMPTVQYEWKQYMSFQGIQNGKKFLKKDTKRVKIPKFLV